MTDIPRYPSDATSVRGKKPVSRGIRVSKKEADRMIEDNRRSDEMYQEEKFKIPRGTIKEMHEIEDGAKPMKKIQYLPNTSKSAEGKVKRNRMNAEINKKYGMTKKGGALAFADSEG